MGVHGLWKLIEPSGQMVPLESLAGKVLAVDISIWLHQAVKGMHDAQGAPLAVAHLVILFHRLCKLLFYKIKPVFVFDGGVPLLKSQTMAARRQRSTAARSEALRVREKLIKNLLKHEAVRQVLSNQTASAALGLNSFTLPGPSVEEDLYKLPPMAADCVDSECSDAETSGEESDKPSEDIHSVDVTSQSFLNLPAEVRHDILTELIETRKQSSWKSLDAMPKQSDSFSDFQMNRLLKRHAVQTSLEAAGKEMGGRALSLKELEALLGDQGVLDPNRDLPSRRIAQDNITRYMLVQRESEPTPAEFDIMEHLQEVEWSSESDTDVILKNRKDSRPAKEVADILSILEDEDATTEVKVKAENVRCEIDSKGIELEKSGAGESTVVPEGIEKEEETKAQVGVEKIKTEETVEEMKAEESAEDIKVEDTAEKTKAEEIAEDIKAKESTEDIAEEMKAEERAEDIAEEMKEEENTEEMKAEERAEDTVEEMKAEERAEENTEEMKAEERAEDIAEEMKAEERAEENTEEMKAEERAEDIAEEIKAEERAEENTEEIKAEERAEENTDCIVENPLPLISDSVESSSTISSVVAESDNKTPETIDEKVENTRKPSTVDVDDIQEIANSSSDSESDFIPITEEEMESVAPQHDAPPPSAVGGDSLTVVINPSTLSQTKDDLFADVFDPQNGGLRDGTDVPEPGRQMTAEDYGKALEEEHLHLVREKGLQERHALTLTDQMYTDAQELLRVFGVPFVVAPMEAEAQCATLDELGLTEGTITDDSDIWLFGGRVVYKNFFNQNKHVVEYRSGNIEKSLKLTRQELIKMAMLVGSDYTPGLNGIGPVTALEIIASFQTPGRGALEGLQKFRDWFTGAAKGGPPRATLRKKIKNTVMTPGDRLGFRKAVGEGRWEVVAGRFVSGFPSRAVVEAYLHPRVDDSKEAFSWAKPNVDLIRKYVRAKMGWSGEKCDDLLRPVLKKLEEKTSQPTIDKVFGVVRRAAVVDGMLSKRVESAVKRLGNSSMESEESVAGGAGPRKKRKANGPLGGAGPSAGDDSRPAREAEARLRVMKARLHSEVRVPQREMAQKLQEEKKKEAVRIFRTYGKAGKKKRKVFAKEEANLSESSSEND